MGSNNSSLKSEREYLSQYNCIYQVMYDQKHIKDFLLYLRQKITEQGHFAKISGEKLLNCLQDDIETICLKLSLSDIDQNTAKSICDYLQYIVYSQAKLLTLKTDYENFIILLKDKINCDQTKHSKEYKILFERFQVRYEELKEMIQTMSMIDTNTIKACLKTCATKYSIPQIYLHKNNNLTKHNDQKNKTEDKASTLCSFQEYNNNDDLFEAY